MPSTSPPAVRSGSPWLDRLPPGVLRRIEKTARELAALDHFPTPALTRWRKRSNVLPFDALSAAACWEQAALEAKSPSGRVYCLTVARAALLAATIDAKAER